MRGKTLRHFLSHSAKITTPIFLRRGDHDGTEISLRVRRVTAALDMLDHMYSIVANPCKNLQSLCVDGWSWDATGGSCQATSLVLCNYQKRLIATPSTGRRGGNESGFILCKSSR